MDLNFELQRKFKKCFLMVNYKMLMTYINARTIISCF